MSYLRMLLSALVLTLAGCSQAVDLQTTASQIVAQIQANCGIIVNVADVAAALSVSHPEITAVAAFAHSVCDQAKSNGMAGIDPWWTPRLVYVQDKKDNCAAYVNGTCIRKKGD